MLYSEDYADVLEEPYKCTCPHIFYFLLNSPSFSSMCCNADYICLLTLGLFPSPCKARLQYLFCIVFRSSHSLYTLHSFNIHSWHIWLKIHTQLFLHYNCLSSSVGAIASPTPFPSSFFFLFHTLKTFQSIFGPLFVSISSQLCKQFLSFASTILILFPFFCLFTPKAG